MMAQLRMGILPIRVETGRFTNLKLNDRLCQICHDQKVEDELHFLFTCDAYTEKRQTFFDEMLNKNDEFIQMSNTDKLKFCCEYEPRKLAKYICDIFQQRKDLQYTN
jgi:hypothetical protein